MPKLYLGTGKILVNSLPKLYLGTGQILVNSLPKLYLGNAVLPLLKRDPLPKKRDPIETHILTKWRPNRDPIF
jgi:hypothetical protein